MERPVKVACAQVEPVVLDREATLDKLETVAGEAAREGAELVVFPETFVPVYPSSLWAKAFAGWEAQGAKETFARLAQESVAVGSPAERRIAAVAQELGIWIVTGVNEVEPERPGTIYNALLYHSPAGDLALHHRKLVPTNHERLVWGQGDGNGLRAVETALGKVGGLICGAWFYRMAGNVVRPWVGSREVANLLGFLLILAAVIVLGWIVSWIVGAMMKAVKLSWLDRLLGAGFGLARGVFVCIALITAIVAFAPGKDAKTPPEAVVRSRIAPYMIDAAHALTAAAPRELRDEFSRRYEQVKRIWEDTLKHGIPRRLPESEV